jgi:hypothetical protein
MLLRAGCILVLLGILAAGLWPFHAPRNNVGWSGNDTSIRFGRYGSVVSEGEFKGRPGSADDSCSVEIWLKPDRVRSSGTILAFFRPEDGSIPFALRQSLGDLTVESTTLRPQLAAGHKKIYIDNILNTQKFVMISLISSQAGISVYVDGASRLRLAKFRFSSHDLAGKLVLGNSPVTTHEWSGQIRTLAIYSRALAPLEVSQHYESWTRGESTGIAAGERVLAFYTFHERTGNLVRNQVDPSTDLLIPDRFFVLQPRFLERPWDEFRNDWNYWQDFAINIAGFVPLGVLFYGYFLLLRRTAHPAAATIFLGFLTSLTIEVLQYFLPTRDSGMTDLFTNTLGTAVGVALYRLEFIRSILLMIGAPSKGMNVSQFDPSDAHKDGASALVCSKR